MKMDMIESNYWKDHYVVETDPDYIERNIRITHFEKAKILN